MSSSGFWVRGNGERAKPRQAESRYFGVSLLRLAVPGAAIIPTGLLAARYAQVPPLDLLAALALLSVGMLLFGVSRVDLTDSGIQIGMGPWAFPRRRMPWGDVEAVRPITVSPIPGRWKRGTSFYCVRPGSALEITLRTGSTIDVSVGKLGRCLEDISIRRS